MKSFEEIPKKLGNNEGVKMSSQKEDYERN
jgi:hypothetical protein